MSYYLRRDVPLVPDHDLPSEVRLFLLHRRHYAGKGGQVVITIRAHHYAAPHRGLEQKLSRVWDHHRCHSSRPRLARIVWHRRTTRNQVVRWQRTGRPLCIVLTRLQDHGHLTSADVGRYELL